MFTSVESTYPCFKRPHRIGDDLDVEGVPSLIIGIEQIWFDYRPSRVIVQYTVQHLVDHVPAPRVVAPTVGDLMELGATVTGKQLTERTDPWNKHRPLDRYRPGDVLFFQGNGYKIVEYTDIDLVGTDYVIHFSVRPLRPVAQKEARARLLQARKARSGLHVLPPSDKLESSDQC